MIARNPCLSQPSALRFCVAEWTKRPANLATNKTKRQSFESTGVLYWAIGKQRANSRPDTGLHSAFVLCVVVTVVTGGGTRETVKEAR